MKFFKKNLWIVFLILIAIALIQLRILVSVFGFNFFIVSSGSMQPEIGVGDLIIVAPSNEYNIGDIVDYNGTLYKSLIDGNVWSPEEYPAGWEKV